MNQLTSQINKKRGTSYILYAIALVGIVGLALVLVKVYVPETSKEILDQIEDSQLHVASGVGTETETLLTEISSIEEAIMELQSLGCTIVNTTEYASSPSGIGFTVEYPEFRKVALKQKMVFLYSFSQPEYNKKTSILTTAFVNIYVGCVVTETINVEEEIIEEDYTSFERVEIQSGTCIWSPVNFDWVIALKMKNTGTGTATLIGVFINDVEVNNYTLAVPPDGQAVTDMGTTVTLASGASTTINIHIDGQGDAGEGNPPIAGTDYWYSVTSGTTINIKVHSAGGMDYIKLVELV